MNKIYKLAVLTSHPIQYQTPLFQKLARHHEIDLMVYFCSDYGVTEKVDSGFGMAFKWDIPLLDSYRYKFLRNFSLNPSPNKIFGLINLGIPWELIKERHDAVIVHGWSDLTSLLAIISAKIAGSKVFLRGENPLCHELKKPLWKRLIKRCLLQQGLFRLINAFLYIGEGNRAFYKYYGVPDKKFFFTPYSVDNERFYGEYIRLKDKKTELRGKLQLSPEKVMILYVAKFIDKKRPLDLLKAYKLIRSDKKAIVFVGEGYLRRDMERYIRDRGLKDVCVSGFKNQTELPTYYTIGDIFVLPSGVGETWGLVVNEAMNFELPIIVSDMVGSGKDLVKERENGFVFPAGDVARLAECLEILIKDENLRKNMGKKSLEIVKGYTCGQDSEGILAALEHCPCKSREL